MTGRLNESDFIADFLDLPEYLPDDQFKAQYGGVDGEKYKKIVAEIESRLNRLPIYN